MAARKKPSRSKETAARRPTKPEPKPTPSTSRPQSAKRDPAVDDYLARVSPSHRELLDDLRKMIHALAPEAEECISYRLPAFRHRGKIIAGFSARSNGCSYYPFSGTTLGTLAAEIEGYSHTKSALHFGADKPLTRSLLKKLLNARIAEGAQVRRRRRRADKVVGSRSK